MNFGKTVALAAVLACFSPPAEAEIATHDIFTAVLVLEAAGEGYVGMQAVANVVCNRSTPTHSIRSVLLRRKQFSCLNGRTPEQAVSRAMKDPMWPVAYRLAADAMVGQLADITYGATHYHSGKRPSWAKRMRRTITLGDHYFYR